MQRSQQVLSSRCIRSSLLETHGFAHAFTTRHHPAEEATRLLLRTALDAGHLYEATQVHGIAVQRVDTSLTPAECLLHRADALLTSDAGLAVAVRTADCLPLLVADRCSGKVAAVHAGWRGALAGVVLASVEALLAVSGSHPRHLLAAIGPHIRPAAFAVDALLAERLAAAAGEAAQPRLLQGDLALLVRRQLAACGLASSQIDDVGGCTFADHEQFFSFRRDGERAGRQFSAIAARSLGGPEDTARRINQ